MIMIMAIVIKGNYYYAKKFPRILWCFFFLNIFYNVDNFIARRMSDNICHYNICHNNKITFGIKYLPTLHQAMASLIT